jgi:hypothetical protein
MTRRDSKEQMGSDKNTPAENADETRSGTPNPTDPNKVRSTEHKSGYGGDGGEPRTSSDKREKKSS